MKECRVCELVKPENDFEVIKASGNRRRVCRLCIAEQKRIRWEQNPEARERSRRSSLLKYKYGITLEKFESLLEAQGGVCPICKRKCYREMSVDHDHSCCPGPRSCGKCVRGILCQKCNSALGMLDDSPERLSEALRYLGGD